MVHISPDGSDRRNLFQSRYDLFRSNVSGMNNVLRALQGANCLRTKQAVRIRDYADDHLSVRGFEMTDIPMHRFLQPGFYPRPGIHVITQSVANKIER